MARGHSSSPGAAEREKSRDIAALRRLFPFLRPYRRQMAIALVALTIAAATVLALGNGLKALIDQGFGTGNAELLNHAVVVMIFVILVLAAATYGRFYYVSWIGERVIADLRKAVFDRVVTLSPGFFELTRTGEVISRLTTDTTVLQTVIGSTVSVALRNLLLLIGGTVMLFVTNWKLTGLVFLVVPVVVLPILTYGRQVRRLSRASQDRIATLGVQLDESLHAIRTVQAFTHERRDGATFGQMVEDAFAVAVERIGARAILTAIVIALVFGAIVVILWIGGHDVLAGKISGGELSAFVFYAVVVAAAVGALSEVMGDLQRAAGATERLIELLEAEPEIRAPDHPKALPSPLTGAVGFRDVSFHYPTRPERSALDHFELSVAPGEKVALVGPSGAGKTTVLQLILRFYDPGAGAVSIDGIDVKDLAPNDLRAHIGLVPHEPVIFAADAWENIRYGRPDATNEDVRKAAEAAYALEFLDRLPDGFATFLGERGVRLSGGQRQRIAIARALLRNPAVLLLDEATSALDAESEQVVQRAFDSVMAGRTTIMIAHRLATVLKADRILVMDAGKIVAAGTHESLMREGGLYARLAALQFDVSNGRADLEAASEIAALAAQR
jgi:ATP-binding cassette, subfamily B, bacterial